MNRPRIHAALLIAALLLIPLGDLRAADPSNRPAGFVESKTLFQTNLGFDPRIGIAVDGVIVHRHGGRFEQHLQSWMDRGFLGGRMFFADSDAANAYWTGKWDGTEYPEDVERDRRGEVVKCAGVRPYMLPTEGWIRYLREMAVASMEAGAQAILPEEPLAHVFTGYEQSFRQLWAQRYGFAWRGQHEDDEARFLTAQLKNELYVKLEKELLETTKVYAREQDRQIGFVLPIHSIYSNIAAQLVAPLGTSLQLDGVDGYIGQIWTGPVNWALGHYDSPDESFFASAYVLYDYFTQLTVASDRKLWLLIDPVEDDPDHAWSEFTEWYKHGVAAMLLMREVDSYEIAPWPDRIFLPGYGTGGGTPAPEDYRTTILAVTQALQDVPRGGHWVQDAASSTLAPQAQAEGIGVAVADTLMWQRHEGPWLQGMYGMLLPLVAQGVPVSSFVMERVGEGDYLDRFKLIVLSYEEFKPLEAGWNASLAGWVRGGGRLIVLNNGQGGLNSCRRFWWQDAGFELPTAHLLSVLGVPDDSRDWKTVGQGGVLRLPISARELGKPGLPREQYLRAVRQGIQQVTGSAYQMPGHFCMQRGDFVVAHAVTKPLNLAGTFVDVFDPSLAVVEAVQLQPGQSGLYRDVAAAMQAGRPSVLHCTHRLMDQSVDGKTLTFTLRGPAETPAVVRLFFPGGEPEVSAVANETRVDVRTRREGNTLLLRFPNDPAGVTVTASAARTALFEAALENGRMANEGLRRCRRFVEGWLAQADPETGLIPRNLSSSKDIWNAQDAAADNYPFMVLTAAITDRGLFQGRMLDMLRTEMRLTSRIDSLPDTWSFTKDGYASDSPDLGSILFGASEYIKDGLLPLTEWLGPSPWSQRMIAILNDMWKHAPVETPYGPIVSENVEVNGEMLQALSRIHFMTGDEKYLDWAVRLGDTYLLGDHHPTRDFDRLRLRDHGCEIVSGLCELYAAVHFARPEKRQQYRRPIHEMLDRILEVGRTDSGLFYNWVNPKTGEHDKGVADTWGYTYNGYYTVYLLDGAEPYRDAVLKALRGVTGYRSYAWEGASSDGYADSIESGVNLYNREPLPETANWIDTETLVMWSKQQPSGIIEGWHGDGNFARTTIMVCLWKSQGCTVEPWREDLILGAVRSDDGALYVALQADTPWKGRLHFDTPRHRTVMNLPLDWPRINQFPEWFTVDPATLDARYAVGGDRTAEHTAADLLAGLPVELEPGRTLRITIHPEVSR